MLLCVELFWVTPFSPHFKQVLIWGSLECKLEIGARKILPFLVNCNIIFNILTAGTHLSGLKKGTEKELNVVMLKMVAALTARSVRNTGKELHVTALPS